MQEFVGSAFAHSIVPSPSTTETIPLAEATAISLPLLRLPSISAIAGLLYPGPELPSSTVMGSAEAKSGSEALATTTTILFARLFIMHIGVRD